LVLPLLSIHFMDRFKRFLTVLCVAGCSAGGGSGAHDDAGFADDGHPAGQDAHDGGQVIDGGPPTATNDRCANAIPISIATMHSVLAATTNGAQADITAPCGAAGVPDVFFKFTLTRRELVYADTFGTSSNTTLFFASSCTIAQAGPTTPGDAVCSTGACGTGQSQVTALLDPGTHYLVLAGQGAATIHFQHAEVGTGSVAQLAQGSSTSTGTTTQFGSLNVCEASGGENSYWWQTCPSDAGGAFVVSTCSATTFDTILSFRVPGTEAVMCDDDDTACLGDQSHSTVGATIPAGAGLFILAVDGFSTATYGNYTLSASRP
jgi:hypothetical protein